MAATVLRLWHDAAMTTEITSGAPLELDDAGVAQIYAGSPTVGLSHERQTLPGVNQLQVSVVDASTGTGVPDTVIKLALTEAGLATAVAGDPLDLGVEILSGTANGVSVWVQFDDSVGVVAEYNDISLAILDVQDSPV